MAYSSNKTPAELSELSSLATNDTIIVGDTSDTSEVVKKITAENLYVDIAAASMTMTNKIITTPTITLKQSASPTPTAEGDIQWDTDDNKIVVGDGATSKVFVPTASISGDITMTTAGVATVSATNASFDALAAEDLTAGTPVGISNILSGYVSKAAYNVKTAAHGISSYSTSRNNSTFCTIGGNKFVTLSNSTASTDTLYAQVGSVDRSTNTITLGTAAAVATAYTPGSTEMGNTTVCKLDTDKFVVFYVLDSSTTVIKYRVGDVSGTTITFGAEATFIANTVGLVNVSRVSFGSTYLSQNKGVMFFKTATATESKMAAFTCSGTTLTIGATSLLGVNTDDLQEATRIARIGADKYVVVCHNASSSLYAQVCTVSGTTITAGSEVQISTAVGTSGYTSFTTLQITSPADDVFVVRTQGASTSAVTVVACTVSGTVPTAGTTVAITGDANFGAYGGIYATDSSTLYITGGGSTTGVIHKITLSGTTITSAGRAGYGVFGSSIATQTIYLENGYPVILENTDATNLSYWIYGMANNFVGIAQSSVSKEGTVTVVTHGVDSNQSGLFGGGTYLVSSGAISLVSPNTTVNTIDDMNTVKALSSTQIII